MMPPVGKRRAVPRSGRIAQQGKGYPLLWSHRHDEPIGIARVEDSRDALLVHGQLLLEDPAAARGYSHLKAGTIKGLSIGFTVPRGEGKTLYRDDGVRALKEIRLHEISVVAVAAKSQAQVFTVKSLGEVRHTLSSIRDGDVTAEVLDDLQQIDLQLKSLLSLHDPRKQQAEFVAELKTLAAQLERLTA